MEFTLQEAKELVDLHADLVLIYKENRHLGVWGGGSDSFVYYLEHEPDATFINSPKHKVQVLKNNKLNRKLYSNNIKYKNYLIVDKSK